VRLTEAGAGPAWLLEIFRLSRLNNRRRVGHFPTVALEHVATTEGGQQEATAAVVAADIMAEGVVEAPPAAFRM